jgi:glucan 1,3-beta-glucosidase
MASIKTLKLIAAWLPLFAPATTAPTGPPSFPDTNNYTITTAGTHGNQGAHAIAHPNVVRAAKIADKLSTLQTRNGAGSSVSGSGLNWYTSSFSTGNSGYSDPQYYYCFGGSASDFPPFSNWMNFYAMFDLNQQDSMDYEESGPIQGDIWNAIVQVSADSKVDARFILAIIMQESTANVYVPCTNNGVENCGLMQAYAGSVSFDPNNPQSSITQMVIDGTQGTSQGPGLVQWFNDQDYVNNNAGGNPYNVARGYNSGSIDFNNLNDGLGSTNSYVSDVANRLQGWNGNDGEGYRAACGW